MKMSPTFRSVSRLKLSGLVPVLVFFVPSMLFAQGTSFTYQGRLQDGGTVANGSYDLQFTLWDALSGGTQQPQPTPVSATRTAVAVSGGIFTVQLDFTVNAFPGADRFLEIGVRPAGGGGFTVLAPRQQITSTPYALRSTSSASADTATNATNATNAANSTNATQLGGVAASQYVLTNDSRMIDARAPTAGSTNYIQNTTSQQTANFNISGSGSAAGSISANVFSAATQYNLEGVRVLRLAGSPDNLLVGFDAGGQASVTGLNTFVGAGAGSAPGGTYGEYNTFLGASAGNNFFGTAAGANNTLLGARTSTNGQGLSNATAVGYSATVTQSNSVVLGNNANVGIGTSAPRGRLEVVGNGASAIIGDPNCGVGSNTVAIGFLTNASLNCGDRFNLGASTSAGGETVINRPTGGQISFREGNGVDQMRIAPGGNVSISSPGTNRARLETWGAVGNTAAVFGGDGTGVSLTRDYPFIGFNSYFNSGWKAISAGYGGHVGIEEDVGAMTFYVNGAANASDANVAPVETMRITQLGRVGIGTTAPDQPLTVNGGADKPGGGSWGTFSDERLKNLKGRFTPGLRALMQLEPLRYEYKQDNVLGIKSSGEHIGFSAQAVQKIIHEAVTTNDKGYLLVNNDPILWTMLNAIKEQQREIAQLKGQIRNLRVAVRKRGDRAIRSRAQ